LEIGQLFSDWVTALHLASARSGAEEFVELMLAMINRNRHGIWNFQEITNRAVVERLQRDSETIRGLKNKLSSNPTESETASLPRYLMVAGAFDDGLQREPMLMCDALGRGPRRGLMLCAPAFLAPRPG